MRGRVWTQAIKEKISEKQLGIPRVTTGSNHPQWRGGIRKFRGYRMRWTAPNVYELEHRCIMRIVLGRDLKPIEIVHHINGRKSDNRKENLVVMMRAEHTKHHHQEREEALACPS